MDLQKYFDNVKGLGVLATSDDQGLVDTAVYAKPHIMDGETVAFIMADRLTHHNLKTSDHAAYLFKEEGAGYKGTRLFLTKLREEQDSDLLYSIRSKRYKSVFLSFHPTSRVLADIKPDFFNILNSLFE